MSYFAISFAVLTLVFWGLAFWMRRNRTHSISFVPAELCCLASLAFFSGIPAVVILFNCIIVGLWVWYCAEKLSAVLAFAVVGTVAAVFIFIFVPQIIPSTLTMGLGAAAGISWWRSQKWIYLGIGMAMIACSIVFIFRHPYFGAQGFTITTSTEHVFVFVVCACFTFPVAVFYHWKKGRRLTASGG